MEQNEWIPPAPTTLKASERILDRFEDLSLSLERVIILLACHISAAGRSKFPGGVS